MFVSLTAVFGQTVPYRSPMASRTPCSTCPPLLDVGGVYMPSGEEFDRLTLHHTTATGHGLQDQSRRPCNLNSAVLLLTLFKTKFMRFISTRQSATV